METTVQINSSDEALKHRPSQTINEKENGVDCGALKKQLTINESAAPEIMASTQEQMNNHDDNGAPSVPVHLKDVYDPETIDR